MKTNLTTIMTAIAVILITATFGIAEGMSTANAWTNFPYFHLGALVIGGLTIMSLQQRYPRLRMSETVGSFALYAVMVSLFTIPVSQFIRTLIG
jgi:hypothetical protein